jgi:hypothetical protein
MLFRGIFRVLKKLKNAGQTRSNGEASVLYFGLVNAVFERR